jgi:hypothetical protein
MEARRSRAERFCSAEPLRLAINPTTTSFHGSQKWGCIFIAKWVDQNEAIALKFPTPWSELLDQTIKGDYSM